MVAIRSVVIEPGTVGCAPGVRVRDTVGITDTKDSETEMGSLGVSH